MIKVRIQTFPASGERKSFGLRIFYQMRRKTPPFRAEKSGVDPAGVNPGFPAARFIA